MSVFNSTAIRAAVALLREWSEGVEFEERAFSVYADDVLLEGIVSAAERRELHPILMAISDRIKAEDTSLFLRECEDEEA